MNVVYLQSQNDTNQNTTMKILAVYPPVKSNSSDGNWCVNYDAQHPNGLKFNGYEFTFTKKEAIQKFNGLTKRIGIEYNAVSNN